MKELLRRYARLFGHLSWANALLARAVAEGTGDARALRVLGHLLATEWLWLRRLGAPGPSVAVWPQWTAAECGQQVEPLAAAWRAVLEELAAHGPAGLRRKVEYTSSRGEPWTSSVEDVLDHVLLHGSHHRGQIVSLLRESGMEPPLVDYAHAARANLLPA